MQPFEWMRQMRSTLDGQTRLANLSAGRKMVRSHTEDTSETFQFTFFTTASTSGPNMPQFLDRKHDKKWASQGSERIQ